MGKPSRQDPNQTPKPGFVTDVLRAQLLKDGLGVKEGTEYVFRGMGKVGGAYPRAACPRTFFAVGVLRGKATTVVQAHAGQHSVAAVARLFSVKSMGHYFPEHAKLTEGDRAAAVLAFSVFHPNDLAAAA